MTDTQRWRHLADVDVPARPPHDALWTLALPYVGPSTLLCITADPAQRWAYGPHPADTCGPNGAWSPFLSTAQCLNPKAPFGSLVGKIGGSTAEPTGLHDFVVGSFCIVEVPSDKAGPLYLTINDLPSGFADNAEMVRVGVHAAEPSKQVCVDLEKPPEAPEVGASSTSSKSETMIIAEPPGFEKPKPARLLTAAEAEVKVARKVKATVTGLRLVSRLAVASQEIRMPPTPDSTIGERDSVLLEPPTISAHVSGKGQPSAEIKLELEINGKKKDRSFKMQRDIVVAKKLEFKYADFGLPLS